MATTFNSVRPGDVISSDLMNFLLSKLGEIDQRVSTLEAGGSQTGLVKITGFNPPNQQAAGQVLNILGSNFAFPPTDNSVTLDSTPVPSPNFRQDSTGSVLRFIIPQNLDVPSAGKNFKITVTNVNGTVTTLYRILPFVPVAGNPPVITNAVPADGSPLINIGQPLRVTGQHFASIPSDNIITFSVTTDLGQTITYPKPGQNLQIDTGQSNTTQIVVTVPDIAEVPQGLSSTPVSLQVGVGAHVPFPRVIQVNRF